MKHLFDRLGASSGQHQFGNQLGSNVSFIRLINLNMNSDIPSGPGNSCYSSNIISRCSILENYNVVVVSSV